MNRSQPRRATATLTPAADSSHRTLWIIRLLILVAILAAFGRTFSHDFVDWDDSGLIYVNPNLNPPTLAGLAHHWNPFNPDNKGMYDPLVYTTWWGLAQGAQLETPDLLGAKLNPEIFHIANLAVHWLTACLVLEILLRFQIPPWPAAGGALIFAIHPLQTEAVMWATGMKDLLCGFFCMATIWVHLCGKEKIGEARTRNDLAAAALFLAALLCKPSAVVLPLIILMLDVVLLRRPAKDSLIRIAPWLVIAAIFAVLTSCLQPATFIPNAIWARPLVAADAIAFYMAKLAIPINLAFDYGRSPGNLLSDPGFHHALYWTWIFPTCAAILIFRFRQNRRLVAAAGIFLLALLPVLGLTTFIYQYYSTVADRYVYLPMLGVAVAVSLLLQKFHGKFAAMVFTAIAVILVGISFVQAGYWKDSESLYGHDLVLNDQNPLHYFIFGKYRDRQANLALRRAEDDIVRGDHEAAGRDTRDAGQYFDDAIDDYRKVIVLDPQAPLAYDKLSFDLIRTRQLDDAIDVIRRWIDLQPALSPEGRQDPAKLQYTLGIACYQAGRYAEAAVAFQQSLNFKSDPDVERHLELRAKKRRRRLNRPRNPAMNHDTSLMRSLWVRLLLAAAVLLVYGQTFGHDFVDWDDRALIYGNPNLNPPTLAGLAHQWNPANPANGGMYDPIVYTLWWSLTHVASGHTPDLLGATLDPGPFHAANVFVHILNVWLIFEILLALHLRKLPAIAGALLFALHPLQAEPIAWATGMKDLLAGFFALAAIWRHFTAPESKYPRANDLAAGLFFIAALLCKPSVVTVPFIAAALDVIVLKRSCKQTVVRLAWWLIPSIVVTAIAVYIQPIHDVPNVPWYLRPLIAGDALAFYLVKLVYPVGLNFDYGRTPSMVMSDPLHPLYWTWLLPAAVAARIAWLRRPYLSAATWVFLLGLLPVLGLLPFLYQYYSTVADRYVYLAMLGPAIIAAWFLQKLPARAAASLAALVLVVFSAAAFVQTERWSDTPTLYEYSQKTNPDHFNPLHLDVLGKYYEHLSEGQRGENLNRAIDCYTRSIQLDPLFPKVYDVLCDDLVRAGRFDDAIKIGQSLIDVQPKLPVELRQKPAELQYRLGMLYFRAGQYAPAREQFQKSIDIDPTPDALKMLQVTNDRLAASTRA